MKSKACIEYEAAHGKCAKCNSSCFFYTKNIGGVKKSKIKPLSGQIDFSNKVIK